MVDFLLKKRVKNNGIVMQYYVENSHESIIPRDLYMHVRKKMVWRANLHRGAKKKNEYTTVSTLYGTLFTASNVGIFIARSPGITEGNILRSGGAVLVLSMNRRDMMQ